ncbi:restriction endonuclease subunit S, partial [Enterococcus ureasiticus]|uniref:restriction endonuclease subunit S n=1 Tax=Enterococcus ureasiticus TaxID=903984 RepID=UPI001112CD1F
MKYVGRNVPVVRFDGFSDAWEQRKLGESFDFPVSTNSLSRAHLNYDEGDIKSVHYGDILVRYTSILEVEHDKIPYITNGLLDKYRSNLLENGDLIFADAAEDETVGKAVEVNGIGSDKLVAGLHTIVARPKEKKAKYFLGYYINSNIYHRQLLRLIQGTKVSSISKGNLQKTTVTFPKSIEEQKKIGAFFKSIDDAIALHQRKLDTLKQMKKGFLQQIFPKNGDKVPV